MNKSAERGEMICVLESAEMASMVVVVENKDLFGSVCSMLNFQMCHVITTTNFMPIT